MDVDASVVLFVADGSRAESDDVGGELREEHLADVVPRHAQVRRRARARATARVGVVVRGGGGALRGDARGFREERGAVVSQDSARGVEGPVRLGAALARVARAARVEDAEALERGVRLAQRHAVALPPRRGRGVALEDDHARARLRGEALDRRRERQAGDAPARDDHDVLGAEPVPSDASGGRRASRPGRRRRGRRVGRREGGPARALGPHRDRGATSARANPERARHSGVGEETTGRSERNRSRGGGERDATDAWPDDVHQRDLVQAARDAVFDIAPAGRECDRRWDRQLPRWG